MIKFLHLSIALVLCLTGFNQTDSLPQMTLHLESVEINADNDSIPDHMQMRTLENFGIYAGRKTELILPSENIGNNSSNQAREQFAQVSGLNIWEDPSGLQLNLGSRGLDPNRSSNFNTRQDAYPISADPLGYPESYYSPVMNTVERIEILRGTSALQYGSQFGGMIKFRMKTGRKEAKLHLQSESGISSFNTQHFFNSLDGSAAGYDYYISHQLRNGDGWRPNSNFSSNQFFARVGKKVHSKLRIQFDWSYLNYLSKQPGGLTDTQFLNNPRQSLRNRNWFSVNWNILSADLLWQIRPHFAYTANVSALNASREALGFLGKINRTDPGLERDLISGTFNNYTFEQRVSHRHELFRSTAALVAGTYHFKGNTQSRQGLSDAGSGATFSFIEEINTQGSDFEFSSQNHAVFAEELLFLSEKIVLSTGFRAEIISTGSDGYYMLTEKDGAGNILPGYPKRIDSSDKKNRNILLAGVGFEWRSDTYNTLYFNATRNYRALNFSDLYINIPGLKIDPGIRDESGYNADLGWKRRKNKYFAELGTFATVYKDRVGLVQVTIEDNWLGLVPVNLRTNVGNAIITGLEFAFELKTSLQKNWQIQAFTNGSLIQAKYYGEHKYKGNFVEYVPLWTSRTGLQIRYKKMRISYLFSATGKQYTNADNNEFKTDPEAVTGAIPAWWVHDCAISYHSKNIELKAGSNNLLNSYYFSRRANGYPGPGVLPSDGRSFYLSLKIDLNLL